MFEVPENTQPINPSAKDDGIQLPFVAPIFYWRHGDSRLAAANNVQYFGGWETQEDDVFISEFGQLPQGFHSLSHKWGKAMGARSLTIAPIRTRKRWLDRSHSQTLCLVAYKNEAGRLEKLGVSVLSLKGWATKYLDDALKAWEEHSKDARKQWASYEKEGKKVVIPSWYFWMSVGTFGDFESETVGSGNSSSETTQPKCYLPKIQSEDQLKLLYVGKENYALMSELYKQAEEWANDERWQKGEEQLISETLPEILTRGAGAPQDYGEDPALQEEDVFPW